MKIYRTIFHTGIIAIVATLLVMCDYQPRNEMDTSKWEINDSTLLLALENEITAHPEVSSVDIKMKSEDGIVTLYGSVDNLLEKEEAIRLVKMTRGVKGVIDLIDVKGKKVEDNELEDNVTYALSRDPVLDAYEIIVRVDSGKVALYGAVYSWHEKQLAEDVVKKVKGTRAVDNNLSFKYIEDRPLAEIQENIQSLMRNDIRLDDGLINVAIDKDQAILSGTVGSAAEKSLAITLAHVPGIDTVLADDLEVSTLERDPLMRKDKYVEKPDVELVSAILTAFLQDPRLNGHNIDVTADDGKITLEGDVSNLRARMAAVEDARNIVGVWDVVNKIKVAPDETTDISDVAAQVRMAIDRHPLYDDYDIEVSSADAGIIQLDGEVRCFYEMKQASDIASEIPGVIEITNNIDVTQGVCLPYAMTPDKPELPVIEKPVEKSDSEIREDIIYQYYWSPYVDRNQVIIDVENGVVTLTGTVNTILEMERAVENAYEGGAYQVDNQLKVDFWQI